LQEFRFLPRGEIRQLPFDVSQCRHVSSIHSVFCAIIFFFVLLLFNSEQSPLPIREPSQAPLPSARSGEDILAFNVVLAKV
jgi:hypothetical protein